MVVWRKETWGWFGGKKEKTEWGRGFKTRPRDGLRLGLKDTEKNSGQKDQCSNGQKSN